MLFKTYSLLLTIALLVGESCAWGTEFSGRVVNLKFLKDATISASRIYLGDIASCTGDVDLCSEVGGIDVSASPQAGRSVYVPQSQVSRLLEKEWPGVSVMFDVQESVKVTSAVAEVRSDDIRQKLQRWINNQIDYDQGLRLTVTKVSIPFGSGIRPSQTQVEFPDLEGLPFKQPDWVARNMIGSRLTQLKFINPKDPDDQQTVQGQVYFNLEKMLPTAATFLSSGTLIEAKDISLQWVVLRRGVIDLLSTPEQIVGRKLRQFLPAGEPFGARNLEAAHVVARNQSVTMLLKNGGLEISTKATTVDAGAKGQIVDVVNAVNRKRMRAKVIDEQTVEAVAF